MKASTRRSSVTPSPFDKRQHNFQTVAAALPDPQNRNAFFQTTCLRRDNYSCAATKTMDITHWEELGKPVEVAQGDLEVAHIIPFSYASCKNSLHDAGKIWENLWRCFPAVRRVGMSLDKINDASNGITLTDSTRKHFGMFCCAFKATVCIK